MNENSQLDFHPDAESLNAFAEQALPERERGPMVAHLAVCGRCRQVIFLAQQEAPALETATPPAARSASRSGSRLRGWRVAWIPAAALATALGLAVAVHLRHGNPGTEMAKAAPQNEPDIASPLESSQIVARTIKEPESAVAAKARPQSRRADTASAPSREKVAPAPMIASPYATASSEPIENERAAMPAATDGQEYKAVSPFPQPATAGMRQRVTGTYSSGAMAERAAPPATDAMEERAPSSRKTQAWFHASSEPSASRPSREALQGSNFDSGEQIPAIPFHSTREANPAPLPSGLNIASSVTAQNRTVAIDQAGALFLSRDSGMHWESIARQWTGRAVDVRRVQNLKESSTAAPIGRAAKAQDIPAEVFELRNDKNSIWLSADGTTWTAR